jgi:hypothetical protein
MDGFVFCGCLSEIFISARLQESKAIEVYTRHGGGFFFFDKEDYLSTESDKFHYNLWLVVWK